MKKEYDFSKGVRGKYKKVPKKVMETLDWDFIDDSMIGAFAVSSRHCKKCGYPCGKKDNPRHIKKK